MPDVYDHTTFTKNVLPKRLSSESSDVIEVAAALGWKVLITEADHVVIVSPDGSKRRNFSVTKSARNSGPLKQIRREIIKHADPALLAMASEGMVSSQERPMNRAEKRKAREPKKQTLDNPVYVRNLRVAAGGALDTMSQPSTDKGPFEGLEADSLPDPPPTGHEDGTGEPPAPEVVTPTPAQVAERVHEHRRIVTERPMLAHRGLGPGGTGRSYVSETTDERVWSDGTTDWACRAPGCDFSTDNRYGVSRHYRVHVSAGEVPAPSKYGDLVDDPTYVEPAYSRGTRVSPTRVNALASFLLGIDLTLDEQQIAEAVLAFLDEQGGSGDSKPSEPLTDEQVLNRIRNLVDRGTYSAQQDRIEQMEQRLDDQAEENARLTRAASDAQAQAEQARETMRAFVELATELGGQHGGDDDGS